MTAEPDGIRAVLDASALLAFWFHEAGAEIVRDELLKGAVIGAVNFAEALRKLKQHGTTLPADSFIQQIAVIPFDDVLARMLADFESPHTRKLGLSFGDLACLALAAKLKAPVLTTDRAWLQAHVGVKVKLIR